MSDENERSVASAGSVAGEPLGWAVINRDGVAVRFAGSFLTLANIATQNEEIIPLYRQPQNAVVRLPPLDPNGAPGWNAAIGAVREALSNAGVDWDTE